MPLILITFQIFFNKEILEINCNVQSNQLFLEAFPAKSMENTVNEVDVVTSPLPESEFFLK